MSSAFLDRIKDLKAPMAHQAVDTLFGEKKWVQEKFIQPEITDEERPALQPREHAERVVSQDNQHYDPYPRANVGIALSDEYLRSLATLAISKLMGKQTFIIEVCRFLIIKMSAFVDRQDISEKVKAAKVSEQLKEYTLMLVEVKYLQLKGWQKDGTLEIPSDTELAKVGTFKIILSLFGDSTDMLFELLNSFFTKFYTDYVKK